MQNKTLVFVVVSLVILAAISIVFLAPGNSARRALAAKTAECSDHIDNDGDGYCDAATKKGYCIDGSKLGDAKCKNKNDMETKCVPTNNGVEICDGIDNNCDGQIDEDLYDTRSCGYDVGECNPGTQTRKCYEGAWGEWGVCEGAIDPQPEICNGLDDNCNGIIDDNCINITTVGGKTIGKATNGVGGKPSGGGGSTSTKLTCTDSDGGVNYSIQGHVYGRSSTGDYDIYDSCNGSKVVEMYCLNQGKRGKTPASTEAQCTYACSNGACFIPKCPADQTSYDTCSITKPLYCYNGSLVNDCVKCGCPSNTQTCKSDGTCEVITIISNVEINGTIGNDVFSIHNGYLWLNGANVYTLKEDESVTINGLDGDDTFITAGNYTQIINGGNGLDTYWVDSTDIINDVSPEETAGTTVHTIAQYYQPWTTVIANPDYVKLDSNGEALKDPSPAGGTNYKTTPLFSTNGIHYYDIQQGGLADCYYMAALGTGANEMPQLVKQAIVEIGDGNYIVRMYRGQPIYLKLDADLPCCPAYAKIHNGLWVALLEKAFAHVRTGQNSYSSLAYGWMSEGYSAIFNKGYSSNNPSSLSDSGLYTTYTNALNNDQLSSEGTPTTACSVSGIYASHAYMSINSSDGLYLYTHNPWYGTPGTIKLDIGQFKSCYTTLQISN